MTGPPRAVVAAFVPGEVTHSARLGSGHIHETFAVDVAGAGGPA